MVVRAARNQVDAACHQHVAKRFRIDQDAVDVALEVRLQGLAEGHRLGRHHMHQRATLQPGEHRGIDLPGNGAVVGQDEAASRTT
ncbi:hypothetical protein D3C78_1723270 [compost metagenome]